MTFAASGRVEEMNAESAMFRSINPKNRGTTPQRATRAPHAERERFYKKILLSFFQIKFSKVFFKYLRLSPFNLPFKPCSSTTKPTTKGSQGRESDKREREKEGERRRRTRFFTPQISTNSNTIRTLFCYV